MEREHAPAHSATERVEPITDLKVVSSPAILLGDDLPPVCPGSSELRCITVTTLADEPYGGTETVSNTDGAGMSLKEAVGIAQSIGGGKVLFHPSLAGGLIRRNTPGALIRVDGGPEGGTVHVDGDIDGDGRPDILLSSRPLNDGGGGPPPPDPEFNPNILILVEGGPQQPPGGSGTPVGWGRLAEVEGEGSRLRLKGLVIFDSPMWSNGPQDGLMRVGGGTNATLWLESVLITDCRGSNDFPYYTYLFDITDAARLDLRNVAVVGNHEAFSFNGYYASGGMQIINSTFALSPTGYGVFKTPVFMQNSILVGHGYDGASVRPGSSHNITSGDPTNVLEIHPDGTPSIVLRGHHSNPALDAGSSAPWGIDNDLFGNLRIVDSDGDGTALPDIGATELQNAPPYPVGGTVSGLLGTGLVLQNNGGDDLPIDADGEFTFASEVANGATYQVTVVDQPTEPVQTCTVTNDNGTIAGAVVDDILVTCSNTPPTSESGGPYSGSEGSPIDVDGSGSSDPDGDIIAYEWDFSYDGANFQADATGALATAFYIDDGVYTIALRTTDSIGGFDIAATVIDVGNVAPTVTAGPAQETTEGQIVMLAPATFTDPGALDSHSASVDWGDGSGPQFATVDQGAHTVQASHVYADDGVYTVAVTVDDDGDSGSDTFTVTVADLTPPGIVSVGSVPDTGDGSLSEDEHTSATITQLTVKFNDRMAMSGPGNVGHAGNFLLIADAGDGFATSSCAGGVAPDDLPVAIDSASYDDLTRTTTLVLNAGAPLGEGRYRLFACTTLADTGDNGLDGNSDGTPGDDFTRTFAVDRTSPGVVSLASGEGEPLTDGAITNATTAALVARFDETMSDAGTGQVTNPANYLLVADGGDSFDTKSCAGGVAPGDITVAIQFVDWNPTTNEATLQLQNGTLADAHYRLWVCGALTDPAGNALDGDGDGSGGDDFASTFTIDRVAPANPMVMSTSHTEGEWSNVAQLDIEWSGAADDGAGLAGYSILFNTTATTDPDTTVEIAQADDPHTASEALDDGEHYFHLRSCDLADNCSAATHAGPFLIDTTAPQSPTVFESPSHQPNVPSNNPVIAVTWLGASDTGSGIAGHAWHWSEVPTWTCDETLDGDASTTSIVSPELDDGFWYAHLCITDEAGNWSSVSDLGPFPIDRAGPRVVGVGSVADTGDGVLAPDEQTPIGITQLIVHFDEAMASATVLPEAFRLLTPGDDGVFATQDCNAPIGDDQAVTLAWALPSPTFFDAAIAPLTDDALAQGSYRLVACPMLEDTTGNPLDGQDIGAPSAAWLDFTVTLTNTVTNPNFDADISNWQFAAGSATVSTTHFDANDAWSSGGLSLAGVGASADELWIADQCVPVKGEATHTGAAVATVHGSSGAPETMIGYQLFAASDCMGIPFATDVSQAASGIGWLQHQLPIAHRGAGSRSARITLIVRPGDQAPVEVVFDDIYLRTDTSIIFRNNFEDETNGENRD